jgi:cytochrome b561
LSSGKYRDWVRRTLHWLFLAVVIAQVITGLGITEFRTVSTLTFGLLTKPLAFKIHSALWIPFLVLLAGHIGLALAGRNNRRKGAP